MKKTLIVVLALILCVSCFFAVGCGGEELNFGKEVVKLTSQLDALTQLKNDTVDMAVIDSVMAGYYATTDEFKNDIAVLDEFTLATEQYGIAGRKDDKAFVSKINEALIALKDTDYQTVATTYGLNASLCIDSTTTNPLSQANDNSWEKIKQSGKIVVGYTIFAPIAYDVENNVPTKGFDIDLAKKVVEYLNATYSLNLTVEFQKIEWASKEALLQNETIDLIWNGLTITEERAASMCISVPYLNNYQVAVVKKSVYTDVDSWAELFTLFSNATISVERGSAGESVVVKK